MQNTPSVGALKMKWRALGIMPTTGELKRREAEADEHRAKRAKVDQVSWVTVCYENYKLILAKEGLQEIPGTDVCILVTTLYDLS